jgi:hypothetical protein
LLGGSVAAGAEVQVGPAVVPPDLVNFAFAVRPAGRVRRRAAPRREEVVAGRPRGRAAPWPGRRPAAARRASAPPQTPTRATPGTRARCQDAGLRPAAVAGGNPQGLAVGLGRQARIRPPPATPPRRSPGPALACAWRLPPPPRARRPCRTILGVSYRRGSRGFGRDRAEGR